ncbi:MAG: thiaminase II [Sneathiellaceae bacterium]
MSKPSFIAALKEAAGRHWTDYVQHRFVRELGTGRLPESAFRYYLVQDYLFLLQFARAYALAAAKADDLADMRYAARGIAAILDSEIDLHIAYCQGWGIGQDEMAATPEDPANLAYTRFVMDRGFAGDLLDLHVALTPCILGYGEIGAMLAASPDTVRQGNPYEAWIAVYAGPDYQGLVQGHLEFLEDLAGRRGAAARMPSLARSFTTATRLEADFWQMGLDAAPQGAPP